MKYFIEFLVDERIIEWLAPLSEPMLTLCTTSSVRSAIDFSIAFCHRELCAVTNIGKTT
jgi:hypothetical protein